MKRFIIQYLVLICVAGCPIVTIAQYIVDGSFEENSAPPNYRGPIDSIYFKKLKLITPNIGFRKLGTGFAKATDSTWLTLWQWKLAPDGNTYLLFFPNYGKVALYFSSPLVPNQYYTLRWVSAIQRLTSIPPPDSVRLELGMNILNPTKLLYEAVPLDTFGYRTYAVTFKADSAYPYLFLSQNADGVYNGRASIDNIRLDTCVSVLPKRTIGCVSFPFTLPATVNGKQVYWNTGDTTASIEVTHNGLYIAQIYDSLGCVWVDSIEVNSALINTPAVLTNKQYCLGDSLILQSNYTGNYIWNTGDTSKNITVNDSGYYWVQTSFSLGCNRLDSFKVNVLTPPALTLPKDSSFCAANTVVLNAFKPGYAHYLWNTGSTDSIISITQSGTYTVTFSNGVCSVTDSTVAHRIDIPQLHTDTSFCSHDSIVLNAPLADAYVWNTGAVSQSIVVGMANIYGVTKTINGCSQIDTFAVSEIASPTSSYSTQNLCEGSSLPLQATHAQTYWWSNGTHDSILEVFEEGLYTVQKHNLNCMGIDSFMVYAKPLPIIVSLNDTTVCFDEVAQLLLDAGTFKSYLWQPTGETSRYIYSSKAQPYLLTVTDSNNCSASKHFDVLETCPDFIFVPNAFTPNGDGINDVFLPHTRSLLQYQMTILNRWGQIVFTTTDTTKGWDAKDAPADVYVVQISYHPKGKSPQTISQNITVLR